MSTQKVVFSDNWIGPEKTKFTIDNIDINIDSPTEPYNVWDGNAYISYEKNKYDNIEYYLKNIINPDAYVPGLHNKTLDGIYIPKGLVLKLYKDKNFNGDTYEFAATNDDIYISTINQASRNIFNKFMSLYGNNIDIRFLNLHDFHLGSFEILTIEYNDIVPLNIEDFQYQNSLFINIYENDILVGSSVTNNTSNIKEKTEYIIKLDNEFYNKKIKDVRWFIDFEDDIDKNAPHILMNLLEKEQWYEVKNDVLHNPYSIDLLNNYYEDKLLQFKIRTKEINNKIQTIKAHVINEDNVSKIIECKFKINQPLIIIEHDDSNQIELDSSADIKFLYFSFIIPITSNILKNNISSEQEPLYFLINTDIDYLNVYNLKIERIYGPKNVKIKEINGLTYIEYQPNILSVGKYSISVILKDEDTNYFYVDKINIIDTISNEYELNNYKNNITNQSNEINNDNLITSINGIFMSSNINDIDKIINNNIEDYELLKEGIYEISKKDQQSGSWIDKSGNIHTASGVYSNNLINSLIDNNISFIYVPRNWELKINNTNVNINHTNINKINRFSENNIIDNIIGEKNGTFVINEFDKNKIIELMENYQNNTFLFKNLDLIINKKITISNKNNFYFDTYMNDNYLIYNNSAPQSGGSWIDENGNIHTAQSVISNLSNYNNEWIYNKIKDTVDEQKDLNYLTTENYLLYNYLNSDNFNVIKDTNIIKMNLLVSKNNTRIHEFKLNNNLLNQLGFTHNLYRIEWDIIKLDSYDEFYDTKNKKDKHISYYCINNGIPNNYVINLEKYNENNKTISKLNNNISIKFIENGLYIVICRISTHSSKNVSSDNNIHDDMLIFKYITIDYLNKYEEPIIVKVTSDFDTL